MREGARERERQDRHCLHERGREEVREGARERERERESVRTDIVSMRDRRLRDIVSMARTALCQ